MGGDFFLFFIVLAIFFGCAIGVSRRRQSQNVGEELVRKLMLNNLDLNSWYLFNNVTLPCGIGTTQIDHILVSRFGVFVIETKHYKGWIFGDEKSKQWTQVVWGYKYRFQNPLHQNYKHVKAVRDLLNFLPSEQIIGLVIFAGSQEFKRAKPVGVYDLDEAINFLRSKGEQLISENRMQFSIGRIEAKRLALTAETDIEHLNNLKSR